MTSVSHLVENEVPLASVAIPSTSTVDKRLRASQSSMNEMQMTQDLNEIVSEDEHKKSSTGSYNNLLFRESSQGAVEEKVVQDASQNVYSNIPPTSRVPKVLKNAASDHVYSNIDDTNISSAGNGYSLSNNLDLDLDDPLLTSSFIKKKEKPNNHQYVYNAPSAETLTNVNKPILPSISSSSSTTGQSQITSIELKNVLNVVLQKTNQVPTETKSIVAPSSLRQTMIDTALDLDSLDGSIGNNSQVALMSNKTAIVWLQGGWIFLMLMIGRVDDLIK